MLYWTRCQEIVHTFFCVTCFCEPDTFKFARQEVENLEPTYLNSREVFNCQEGMSVDIH